MSKKILFLTLRVFSATGGIEKVCKVFSKALFELQGLQKNGSELKLLSMYDHNHDVDERYIPASNFIGYNQQKMHFTKSALIEGSKSDAVVLSHINLLSIGFLIKIIHPQTKLLLFAHGIEVWGPLSRFRKRMLNTCDQIIAVSQFTKNKMIEEYGIAEDKISILNNCLDPFLPDPVQNGKNHELEYIYGFDSSDIVLMTLTRISSKERYKGYDHVLIALGELKRKYPTLKYLIVGRYDEMEKSRLDKIIQQFALEKDVVFTGYIPDEELALHFSLADIYVMPSKKEGFGIVFIEAMHYGLPVIAGNKDGSTDALFQGRLGLLINPDDQSELNNAIENMILQKDSYLPNQNLLDREFSYSSYKAKIQTLLDRICN